VRPRLLHQSDAQKKFSDIESFLSVFGTRNVTEDTFFLYEDEIEADNLQVLSDLEPDALKAYIPTT
jgi:hypothetical protein